MYYLNLVWMHICLSKTEVLNLQAHLLVERLVTQQVDCKNINFRIKLLLLNFSCPLSIYTAILSLSYVNLPTYSFVSVS